MRRGLGARPRVRAWAILATLSCAASFALPVFVAPAVGARGGVVLSVAPVPSAVHPKVATPQVTWSTGDGSPGEVTVTPAETKETLFGTGADGSAPAPWITVGHSYVFRLYSIVSGRRLLARLTVGRQQSPAEVVALPRKPKITPPAVNRLLQILAIGSILLLAAFAVAHARELRRDG